VNELENENEKIIEEIRKILVKRKLHHIAGLNRLVNCPDQPRSLSDRWAISLFIRILSFYLLLCDCRDIVGHLGSNYDLCRHLFQIIFYVTMIRLYFRIDFLGLIWLRM
jgi:hypothetical protein